MSAGGAVVVGSVAVKVGSCLATVVGLSAGTALDDGTALTAGRALGERDGAASVGPGVGAARAAPGAAILNTSDPAAARSDRRILPA